VLNFNVNVYLFYICNRYYFPIDDADTNNINSFYGVHHWYVSRMTLHLVLQYIYYDTIKSTYSVDFNIANT